MQIDDRPYSFYKDYELSPEDKANYVNLMDFNSQSSQKFKKILLILPSILYLAIFFELDFSDFSLWGIKANNVSSFYFCLILKILIGYHLLMYLISTYQDLVRLKIEYYPYMLAYAKIKRDIKAGREKLHFKYKRHLLNAKKEVPESVAEILAKYNSYIEMRSIKLTIILKIFLNVGIPILYSSISLFI